MTELMYLERPNLFEASTTITATGNDAKGFYIILDRSLFYPQGGGQPADQGKIFTEQGAYNICDVRNIDNEIRHYIISNLPLDILGNAKIIVDKQRREINTRYHTAGHLIAAIAEKLSSELIAIKGHQFPNEAYVEFEGVLSNPTNFMNQFEEAISSYISNNANVTVKEIDKEQIEILIKNLPYSLPKNKTLRVCHIEGLTPVPCGGTYVQSLKAIGSINIIKCKSKKGKTKIFYEIYT